MTIQEIFEMLSENESKLFYACLANPTDEMLQLTMQQRNPLKHLQKQLVATTK